MIYISNPIPIPEEFEEVTANPGQDWLNNPANAGERPKDFWSQHRSHLARGFQLRCGYLAMHDPDGTVDHYWSCKNYPNRAYDWNNYRYISGRINSSKKDIDDRVLDPFEVQDTWFELSLPDMQLHITSVVRGQQRDRAQYTIDRFRLNTDPLILEVRQEWFQTFIRGEMTLRGLERKVPLISRAIIRRLNALYAIRPSQLLGCLLNSSALLSGDEESQAIQALLHLDNDAFKARLRG